MVIITTFNGIQKMFHTYWLPLMYKHQECDFYVTGKFVYPRDLPNLKINKTDVENLKGPILKCPMEKIPTYIAMIKLQSMKPNWIGTPEELGERFYEL